MKQLSEKLLTITKIYKFLILCIAFCYFCFFLFLFWNNLSPYQLKCVTGIVVNQTSLQRFSVCHNFPFAITYSLIYTFFHHTKYITILTEPSIHFAMSFRQKNFTGLDHVNPISPSSFVIPSLPSVLPPPSPSTLSAFSLHFPLESLFPLRPPQN